MRETNLGWVFSGIGSPSALGVRRDERERVLNSIVNNQFRDDLSVEATDDPIMDFIINRSPKVDFWISRLNCNFKALSVMDS